MFRQRNQLRKLYNVYRQIHRTGSTSSKTFQTLIPSCSRQIFHNGCMGPKYLSTIPKYDTNQEHEFNEQKLDYVTAESIDDALQQIDDRAKHLGRVLRNDFASVFESVKNLGKASSIQSLYLIRCCGALMHDELPAKRSKLLEELWNKLMELNIPVDASHYNAVLKCYLENQYEFSPTSFLANMEKNGITPNRVTFQRLIDKFCDNGDLNGASAILEYMKEKEIAVNESIFNSLIKGHTKAGDFDGAKNVFEVMRKSQLKPSAATYTILLCGYAEVGDIEAMEITFTDARKHDVYLYNKNYLSVIYALAMSGQAQHIEMVFKMMENLAGNRQDLVNTMYDLLNQNLIDVCYDFLKMITIQINFVHGVKLFIEHLIYMEKPSKDILTYCAQWHEYDQFILTTAAKKSLQCGRIDCSLDVLREMQAQGLPVRSHYFWPLFAVHARQKNEQGTWDILKAMTELGVPADYDTYFDYVFPHVDTSNFTAVLSKIDATGQSGVAAINSLFQYYIEINDLDTATHIIKNYDFDVNVNVVLRQLSSKSIMDKCSPASILEVLQFLYGIAQRKNTQRDFPLQEDFIGEFFMHLSSFKNLPHGLLIEAHRLGIELPRYYANYICKDFGKDDPEGVQIVRSMQYGAPLPQSGFQENVHPKDMSLERLEKFAEELKRTGRSTRNASQNLLVHYCRLKDLDKIIATKEDLDLNGFVYTPALYALLFNAFLTFNDLERAEQLKNQFESEFPDATLDMLKVVHYCTLLIKNNRMEDAVSFLRKQSNEANFMQRDVLQRAIKKMLNVAAETGNVELSKTLYDILSTKIKWTDSKMFLEGLVKVHIYRNELEKAVKEYERCLREHKFGPCRNFFFKKLIMDKDFERLQYIVDLTAAHVGKVSTLHELAFSFIECNLLQQAQKVFQNISGRVDSIQIEDYSARLSKDGKIAELENLIKATQDIGNIDRDKLYYNLLNIYAHDNNCSKALSLWDLMQEESIQPSIGTLRLIANLLEKNDQPVPFVVPSGGDAAGLDLPHRDIANNEIEESQVSAKEPMMQLLDCVQKGDVDHALEILHGMKKGHIHSMSNDAMMQVVELCFSNGRHKSLSMSVQAMSFIIEKARAIFKPLLEKYAEAGDLESIKNSMDFLPDFTLKSIGFNYYFNRVHLVKNMQDELMTALEVNVGNTTKLFSFSGFLNLLTSAPHLLERAIKLVSAYSDEEKFDIPMRALWVYYFTNEHYDKAEEIFRQHAVLFTALDFLASQVLKHIRSTQNESLARKFIEVSSAYKAKQIVQDRAYCCLVDVLANQKKIDEAVASIEEAKKLDIPISRFNRKTLMDLKENLVERNLPVPFEVPSLDGDSSSSSDSD